MKSALAVDAGTGSVRALLVSLEGEVLGTAQRTWQHDPEPGVPGSMRFATERNHVLLVECIREALAAAGVFGADVVGVSAASMREGVVLLDADGNELWGVANVDSRAAAEISELNTRPGLAESVYRRSGQTFALAAQPRLLWLERHEPELYARADSVVMLSEWVLSRLGAPAVMEPSNGSTSGLLGLAERQAVAELATQCGLRPELVPPVVEPGSVVGALSPEAAEETGLRAGTPLVVGGGDAQIAALGLAQTEPGQILLTAGTFWQLNVNLDSPTVHPDMAVRINAAAVENLWQAEAITFHPGTAVRWFRDTFARVEVERAEAEGRNPLDVLTQAAATVPIGSDGIISIFSDAMDYRHWTHAAPSFLNLSLDGGDRLRAAMFRSLLENAAVVTAENLDRIAAFTTVDPAAPVVFAGGAASSAVWSQIVADLFGRTLLVPTVTEATALGAAACAASGGAELGSPPDVAGRWMSWRGEVRPNWTAHEQYLSVRERWRTAYAAQRDLSRTGVTEPMWQAPGL